MPDAGIEVVGPRRARIISDGIWGAHERTVQRRKDRYPVSAKIEGGFEAEEELDYYLTGCALAGALNVHVRVTFVDDDEATPGRAAERLLEDEAERS